MLSGAFGTLSEHYRNIIVLDVETSGLDPEVDDIIEAAAIAARASRDGSLHAVTYLNSLVRLPTGKRLSRTVFDLTGIRDEELLAGGISRSQAALAFAHIIQMDSSLIVAHNVQFDLLFILALLHKEGYVCPSSISLLDTLTVFRDRRGYPHRLVDAISAYGLRDRVRNSHRAVDDAAATLDVLRAMALERDDLISYVNLIGYNPRYGVNGRKVPGVRYLPQSADQRRPLTSRRRG